MLHSRASPHAWPARASVHALEARAASAGDIVIARLQVRGVAGLVTDGGLRGTAGIARLGSPACHRRPSAPAGVVRHHAVAFGLPIGRGGVAVYRGELVVGVGDGVVCVPAHRAAEVAGEAVARSEYEDFVLARVRRSGALRSRSGEPSEPRGIRGLL